MSRLGTVYRGEVEPAMSAQFAPAALQRCHWYVYVRGSAPVHAPVETLRNSPATGCPRIVGTAVLTGGACAVAASPRPAVRTAAARTRIAVETSRIATTLVDGMAASSFLRRQPMCKEFGETL
jgi:hypothetical protein